MKNVFVLVVGMCLVATATVCAQTKNEFKFGPKAGVNLATVNLSPDDDQSPSSLIGFTAGVFASIPVKGGFAIQPEVLFAQLGFKQKEETGKSTNHMNYLNVPILAKYVFANTGLSLCAGPQIGVLLSAKAKFMSETVDIKTYLKSTDISGVLGLQYELPMGLNLAARYQLGLTNVYKKTEDNDGSLKNNCFSVTVGYAFHKK